jgi:hypothetical protein
MLDNTSELMKQYTEAKMIRSQLNLKQRRKEDTRKPELIDFKQRSSKLFKHKLKLTVKNGLRKKVLNCKKRTTIRLCSTSFITRITS